MSTITAPEPHPTPAQADPSPRRARRLCSYVAFDTGQPREIASFPRPDGSTFLLDYLTRPLGDGRLVAHLAADEPPENARILCELYLADESRGRCRRLLPEDLELTSLAGSDPGHEDAQHSSARLCDLEGHVYRIRAIPTDGSVLKLRWTRSRHPGREDTFVVVTLRHVITSLEDYEPARTITTEAILAHQDERFSTCRLREELARGDSSATVLNRRLREAVQRRVVRGELSMSEIARRCGRTRSGKPCNHGGEASWLARRIGEQAESGEAAPSPWVNSDVLALIAREGLGLSPHEVEL